MFGSLFGESPGEAKAGEASAPEGNGDGPDIGAFFGSFVSMAKEVGGAVVQEAEKVAAGGIPLIGDFQREQLKFISEKKDGAAVALPPWSGYENEDVLRDQIMALSSDPRNFKRDPPAGQAAYKFDYHKESGIAAVMLQEDPNLSKMRFELVPKDMSEERFWRNYFYRVYLMKQTYEVSSLVESEAAHNTADASTPAKKVETPPSEPMITSTEILADSPDVDDSMLRPHDDGVTEAKLAEVDLADLGGSVDDSSSAPGSAEEANTSVKETDTESHSKSVTPSSGGDGTVSDASWEKEIGLTETETDMSEFELLKDDGGEIELEEGWEDEVNKMLEAEEGDD